MDSRESSRFSGPLAQRVAVDADSRQIAEAAGMLWADIDAALQPLVGRRGVAALIKRCLHVGTARHPWLAPLCEGSDATFEIAQLKALLEAQPPAAALAAGSELFEGFRALLVSLIGAGLSDRLLQPIWSASSSATSAQDPTP